MEPFIGLSLLGFACYGLVQATAHTFRSVRSHRHQRQTVVTDDSRLLRDQQRRQRDYARQSDQYQRLQLAILHLDHEPDPDFRRAASTARSGRDVPQAYRQRQYQRLRPFLVQHYRRCRSRGADGEVLLDSLVELVEALGMPEYEADYIRQEADRNQVQRPTATPANSVHAFQQQLSQAQQEHDQRVQAIRSLPNISDDIREQLLETEQSRYQSQLFGGRGHFHGPGA